MNCPKCGAVVDDNAKFCPVCGEPIPAPAPQAEPQKQVKYCPKCGAAYEGTPAFCPGCGASLTVQNFGQQAQNFAQNVQNGNFNQYFPNSAPGSVPSRSIGLYIVLSIVTCGLFMLYWLVCVVNDLNQAADTPNDTNGITVLLLTIVTCGIYGIYYMFKAGDKVSIIRRKTNQPDGGNNGILYLVLQLFGLELINLCLIQNEINKVSAYRA